MAYLEQTINAIVATANGDDAHARILIAQILGECATRENVDIVLHGVYRRAVSTACDHIGEEKQ